MRCLLAICAIVCFSSSAVMAQPFPGDSHSALLEPDPTPPPGFPTIEANVIYSVGNGTPTVISNRLKEALAGLGGNADAFSYGRDFGFYENSHSFFLWSIDYTTSDTKDAVPRSPLYLEPVRECESDLFWAQDRQQPDREWGMHGKAADENSASPVPVDFPRNYFEIKTNLGLGGAYGEPQSPSGLSQNVQGFDYWPSPEYATRGDIYFSVDQMITVPQHGGGTLDFGTADILLLPGPPSLPVAENIVLFRSADSMGLQDSDDIDALAINLQGEGFSGTFAMFYDPVLWFSLTNASPTVSSGGSGSDIYQMILDGSPAVLHMSAESMGVFGATIVTDIDSLGHVDPDAVTNFSSCTFPSGMGSGYQGMEVVLDTNGVPTDLRFGNGFRPFEGSYGVAVNDVLLPAAPGTVTSVPLTSPLFTLEPGDLAVVEVSGEALLRDLLDRILLRIPTAGSVAPVAALTATADPSTMTVSCSWDPLGADSEVRLDGVLVATIGAAPGTASFTSSPLPPGVHFFDVRRTIGGVVSEPEFAPAELIPATIVQPPHNLSALVTAVSTVVSWENAVAPIGYTMVELYQNEALVTTLPTATTDFSFPGLIPGLHTFRVRGIVGTSFTAWSSLKVFVPIVAPPAPVTPPRDDFLTLPSLSIPGNGGTGAVATTYPVAIPGSFGTTADLDVKLDVSHERPEALTIDLTSPGPAATTVRLVDSTGNTSEAICRHIDDTCDIGSIHDGQGTHRPESVNGAMSDYDGQAIAGTWTITITNHSPIAGTLELATLSFLPQQEFRRGDCNYDAVVNIADPIRLLNFLFPTGTLDRLNCDDACDMNDDGSLNIADAVAGLNALFGVPSVPLPAPSPACGPDPTVDALSCGMACP
ncbi:MAG: hypothetical protein AAF581_13600 [Planctomycetota bacterium]